MHALLQYDASKEAYPEHLWAVVKYTMAKENERKARGGATKQDAEIPDGDDKLELGVLKVLKRYV